MAVMSPHLSKQKKGSTSEFLAAMHALARSQRGIEIEAG